MKDLLQKLADLETTLDSMDPTPKEIKQLNEAANMSINMSGETADEVARLVQIMQNGGTMRDDPKPMGPPDMGAMRDLVKMSPPMDMDMDGPGDDMNDLKPGIQKEPCDSCGKVHLGNSSCGSHEDVDFDEGAMSDIHQDAQEMDKEEFVKTHPQFADMWDEVHNDPDNQESVDEAGYDNSPEEDYKDHNYMTKDLSGGINREKKAYAAAQDGDNAMAVEELQSALRDALMTKMAEVDDGSEEEIESWYDEVVSAITDRNITFPIADNEIQKIADDCCDDWGDQGPSENVVLSIIKSENDQVNHDQKDEDGDMELEPEVEGEAYSIKGKTAEADAELARIAELSGVHDHEDGEDCPECGAPGKKKLMACSSCGCS